MQEQNSIQSEYGEIWDDGTYQTGAAAPQEEKRGVITVLLVSLICFGGVLSALGMMNIRMLSHLTEPQGAVLPLEHCVDGERSVQMINYYNMEDVPLPTIPAERALEFQHQGISRGMEAMDIQQITAATANSVVKIHGDNYFESKQTGVGAILSSDGYVLTNARAVLDSGRIFVTLPDGRYVRAALVGVDRFTDLAVLYVQAEGLEPVVLGSTREMADGDAVYGVTDLMSLKLGQGVTQDTASQFQCGCNQLELMQTADVGRDGPVFNAYGQMVGFHGENMIRYVDAAISRKQSLAVGTEMLLDVVEQLMENGKVEGRPSLGLEVEALSALHQQFWHLPGGLQVTHLEEGSMAERAGLHRGDIFLELEGSRVSRKEDLYDLLYSSCPGDSIRVLIFRNDQQLTLELTVE